MSVLGIDLQVRDLKFSFKSESEKDKSKHKGSNWLNEIELESETEMGLFEEEKERLEANLQLNGTDFVYFQRLFEEGKAFVNQQEVKLLPNINQKFKVAFNSRNQLFDDCLST